MADEDPREGDGSFDATARIVDAGGTDDDSTVEAALRPRRLAEFPGQPKVRDQLGLVLEAARRRGAPPGPRAALRTSRPGQDDPGDDRRRRAGAAHPRHVGAGDPARRRPRVGAVLPRRGGGALPRRDPPDVPTRRGDALPRHGGLPGRRRRRQGAGGHGHPAGAAPPSPSWGRPPARACCRRRCATALASRVTWTSTTCATSSRSSRAAPGSSGSPRTRTLSPRSPCAPGARHASPTACCAACGTGPRSTARARSTSRRPGQPSPSSTSTRPASTGSTARCSTRCADASEADPSDCRRSPSPWGRRPTPSRRSPSPISCGRASSSAVRAVGWPRPRPGSTSGSPRPTVSRSPFPSRIAPTAAGSADRAPRHRRVRWRRHDR
ncbi:Holliday junction DNA helicase subunit RuvB [Janibacter hoylei PVAS-1]|uniref:Holliday junction DNA helicase subunit RuvB n=1 Tax=Janibacter hoylei PVAS-1 TaxID=1210046 RepID=K1DY27_9MICO|nr:Holliday junction DNA helicase subunit RuvB [Janibacter hoylei PVAS-1]